MPTDTKKTPPLDTKLPGGSSANLESPLRGLNPLRGIKLPSLEPALNEIVQGWLGLEGAIAHIYRDLARAAFLPYFLIKDYYLAEANERAQSAQAKSSQPWVRGSNLSVDSYYPDPEYVPWLTERWRALTLLRLAHLGAPVPWNKAAMGQGVDPALIALAQEYARGGAEPCWAKVEQSLLARSKIFKPQDNPLYGARNLRASTYDPTYGTHALRRAVLSEVWPSRGVDYKWNAESLYRLADRGHTIPWDQATWNTWYMGKPSSAMPVEPARRWASADLIYATSDVKNKVLSLAAKDILADEGTLKTDWALPRLGDTLALVGMPGAQVRPRTGLKVATKNLYADQILEGQAESGIDMLFYDIWARQGRAPHRATLEAAGRARAFIAAAKLPGPTRPSHSGGGALPELLAFYDSARPLLLRGVYETVKADWAARAFAGLVSSMGRSPLTTRPVPKTAAFDPRPEAILGVFEKDLRWPPQVRYLGKPARGAAPREAAPTLTDPKVGPELAEGGPRRHEAPWMVWLRTRWIWNLRNPRVSPGPAVGAAQPREAPWMVWLRARWIRNLWNSRVAASRQNAAVSGRVSASPLVPVGGTDGLSQGRLPSAHTAQALRAAASGLKSGHPTAPTGEAMSTATSRAIADAALGLRLGRLSPAEALGALRAALGEPSNAAPTTCATASGRPTTASLHLAQAFRAASVGLRRSSPAVSHGGAPSAAPSRDLADAAVRLSLGRLSPSKYPSAHEGARCSPSSVGPTPFAATNLRALAARDFADAISALYSGRLGYAEALQAIQSAVSGLGGGAPAKGPREAEGRANGQAFYEVTYKAIADFRAAQAYELGTQRPNPNSTAPRYGLSGRTFERAWEIYCATYRGAAAQDLPKADAGRSFAGTIARLGVGRGAPNTFLRERPFVKATLELGLGRGSLGGPTRPTYVSVPAALAHIETAGEPLPFDDIEAEELADYLGYLYKGGLGGESSHPAPVSCGVVFSEARRELWLSRKAAVEADLRANRAAPALYVDDAYPLNFATLLEVVTSMIVLLCSAFALFKLARWAVAMAKRNYIVIAVAYMGLVGGGWLALALAVALAARKLEQGAARGRDKKTLGSSLPELESASARPRWRTLTSKLRPGKARPPMQGSPSYLASGLEAFWTGRGGTFALVFLLLSFCARALLMAYGISLV